MHNETRKFVLKHFPDNINLPEFYQQYLKLSDFVELLFENYENVIGKQSNRNLF